MGGSVAHGQGQQSWPTSLKLANRLDLGRSAGWPPTVDLLLKRHLRFKAVLKSQLLIKTETDEESSPWEDLWPMGNTLETTSGTAKNSGGDCVSGRSN
jgi:hypothetical protein